MKPSYVVCALLCVCSPAVAQTTHNPEQQFSGHTDPSRTQTPREPAPVAFEGVLSSLNAGRKDEALAKAQAIVQMYPASIPANITTGAILLQIARPADAVPYFRTAVAAQPDDAHSHALLLEALAESGDKQRRDEERAILRRFHSDGRHPELARQDSFLIERIPVGNLTVGALEYFKPAGKSHFAYRFDVFDTSDKRIEYFALGSEDAGQGVPPKAATPGQRRYALERFSQNEHALLSYFDGIPNYDDLRARVVKTLTAELDVTQLPTQK